MKVFLIGTRADRTQYEVDTKVEISPRMTSADMQTLGTILVAMLQKDCVVVHAQKS